MLSVNLGNRSAQGQEFSFEEGQMSPRVSWRALLGKPYTLMVYDMSAPYPESPFNSPFLHFLAINSPGQQLDQADILMPYQPLSPPPGSNPHLYVVDLFSQPQQIIPETVNQRNFDVTGFVQRHNLQHLGRVTFSVRAQPVLSPQILNVSPISPVITPVSPISPVITPVVSPVVTPVGNPNGSEAKETWVSPDLSEDERKYCRCVLEVGAKQPVACNVEKAWFQKRNGSTCYNPYAVCSKSVGTTSRQCAENYNFEMLPDEVLQAFASLRRITIPIPYNRAQLIQNIQAYQAQKGI